MPGAPSLSKSLGRLGSMLPRRRPDNAAQDASDDECDADAAFLSKPPLAKTKSVSKVRILQYGSFNSLHHKVQVPCCVGGRVCTITDNNLLDAWWKALQYHTAQRKDPELKMDLCICRDGLVWGRSCQSLATAATPWLIPAQTAVACARPSTGRPWTPTLHHQPGKRSLSELGSSSRRPSIASFGPCELCMTQHAKLMRQRGCQGLRACKYSQGALLPLM